MSIDFGERVVVLAVALLAAAVYFFRGSREQKYLVAPFALVIAALVGLSVLAPVIAYGVLCLGMVSVYLAREERKRRQRVASLAPRPAADSVSMVWVAISALSVLMLTPYVVFGQQRLAAIIVGVCSLGMSLIAWRIASSPEQLTGEDIRLERTRDRAYRLRRSGLTATLAIGIVFVFMSFVNAELPVVLPVQTILNYTSLIMWLALWAWETWYVYRLDRSSCGVDA